MEYTAWMSVEGSDPANEYPGHDIEKSDGEAQDKKLWIMLSASPCHCSQLHPESEVYPLIGSYQWVKFNPLTFKQS